MSKSMKMERAIMLYITKHIKEMHMYIHLQLELKLIMYCDDIHQL